MKLSESQRTVLRHAADCQGDGWIYLSGSLGPAAAGLARRQLVFSRLDHNGERRIKITMLGRDAWEKLNEG